MLHGLSQSFRIAPRWRAKTGNCSGPEVLFGEVTLTVRRRPFLVTGTSKMMGWAFLVQVDYFRVVRLIGIGAAVTHRPLPHHRAYGSVHGGSSWLR